MSYRPPSEDQFVTATTISFSGGLFIGFLIGALAMLSWVTGQ